MIRFRIPAFILSSFVAPLCACALVFADDVFSGPQPGEKASAFKVISISGSAPQTERDPISENRGGPVALVFLHALERSLVPLLRVTDEYGALRKEHLQTEIIFLGADRISAEQKIKAAVNSLKLKSNVGLSVDGNEGPGNYGLNKECMMTIVVAKDNKVTANFALVQPGIADAPKVIEALAKVSGDKNPPSVETLNASRNAGMARGREGEMRRPAGEAKTGNGKDPFPGAVPTDEKLTGLLRRFIRPTNDDATVDKVLAEVKAYIQDNADLRRQAADGWTRVLHFGDRYGTPYARKKGTEFLEELKKHDGAKL
jgi:hypothetical protein